MPISLIPSTPNPAADLETIIRPFLSSQPNSTTQRMSANGGGLSFGHEFGTELTTEERASTITWQAAASVQVTTLPGLGFTVDLGNNNDTLQNETSRQTHTVRISQDGHPENFVDVELVDKISFKNPYGLIRDFNLNNG